MRCTKYLLILLLIPCPWILSPLFAQEPLSLKALVEEVKERNPEILSSRQRVKEKELRAKAEGYLDDPQFQIMIEDIPTERPFNLGNSMLTRYTLSQMFPFPGKLSLRQRMAMKEALMAEAQTIEKELEIVAMLKEAYYDYAFIAESLKVTKEIKDTLSEMARVAEARYSLGQASQQDVIKAQVELTMLINEILTLEAEKGVVQARLNAILSRDPSSRLGEPEGIPRGKINIKKDELIETALIKNPGLTGMAYEIEAQALERELEIVAMLKETYYDYAFIIESLKVTKEIKDTLSEMARVAEARYSLGQATQQDVIKAQVELTMLINEILTLEAEKGVVQARLNAILSRDPSSRIGEPEGIPRGKIAIKTDELIKTALIKNPGLTGMAYEIEAQDAAIDLANKNYYPDFMIGIAPIQREGRFDTWDAMFTINIPLWRSKYNSIAGQAKIGKEALLFRLEAERNIRTMEVKEGIIRVETADRIRSLYETGLLPQVELSFGFALTSYQSGKIDFMTLLDTERVLKRTRIEYLRALIDYNKGIASLEKVVGAEMGGS
ncbi:MAG TPA: TolC family protein [Nitrospiria bacterium]|nr:TolC family protein [Nitrospiria bacterium]